MLAREHVAHGRRIARRVQRLGARRERQHQVVIPGRAERVEVDRGRGIRLTLERGAGRSDGHFARRDHVVEFAAEHRQHDAAVAVGRVDVEGLGAPRGAAVGEHVPPPRVLHRRGDTLVVRHDVDQRAEACRAGRGREPGQALGAAARGIHPRRVDDVVAVV